MTIFVGLLTFPTGMACSLELNQTDTRTHENTIPDSGTFCLSAYYQVGIHVL